MTAYAHTSTHTQTHSHARAHVRPARKTHSLRRRGDAPLSFLSKKIREIARRPQPPNQLDRVHSTNTHTRIGFWGTTRQRPAPVRMCIFTLFEPHDRLPARPQTAAFECENATRIRPDRPTKPSRHGAANQKKQPRVNRPANTNTHKKNIRTHAFHSLNVAWHTRALRRRRRRRPPFT